MPYSILYWWLLILGEIILLYVLLYIYIFVFMLILEYDPFCDCSTHEYIIDDVEEDVEEPLVDFEDLQWPWMHLVVMCVWSMRASGGRPGADDHTRQSIIL